MPAFPGTLPKPLKAGYSPSNTTRKARTEMVAGPDRVLSLASAYVTDIPVTLLCSQTQSDTFWDFYEATINNGTDWFDMTVDTGRGPATHSVRIKGEVGWSFEGPHYRISFTVETQDHNE